MPAVSKQVIVRAKAGRSLKRLAAQRQLAILGSFVTDAEHLLVETGDVAAFSLAIAREADVDVVSPNYLFQLNDVQAPNDPRYGEQWALPKIGAPQAWAKTMGDPKLIVAVVDSGVDYHHPDLQGRVIKGINTTGEGAKHDPIDGQGHGTHVAGIIAAAANNGVGVAGLAPNVTILAEKVLNAQGNGTLFNIAAGIRHAVNHGAKIVNLSLGGPAAEDPITLGVGAWAAKKGVLLVAAAGNSAGAVGTPARFANFYMAVGATDSTDALASFSCFGSELSVVAPGTKILSTMPTYHVPLNDKGYPRHYAALNGTSMATPLVSALAALVWSANPGWTRQQVRTHLERTAVDLGAPGHDPRFGFGRIDAAAALR